MFVFLVIPAHLTHHTVTKGGVTLQVGLRVLKKGIFVQELCPEHAEVSLSVDLRGLGAGDRNVAKHMKW